MEIIKVPKHVIYNGALYEKIDDFVPVVTDYTISCNNLSNSCDSCQFEHLSSESIPCATCSSNFISHWRAKDAGKI